MPKYKIKKILNTEPEYPIINPHHYQWASDMRDEYGLSHLTLRQIVHLWENYSDSLCAGWLIPTKESVEDVFNVVLEEYK